MIGPLPSLEAAEHAMLTMEQKVQCRRPGSIGFRGDFLDGGVPDGPVRTAETAGVSVSSSPCDLILGELRIRSQVRGRRVGCWRHPCALHEVQLVVGVSGQKHREDLLTKSWSKVGPSERPRLCSKYFKSPDHVRKHLNRWALGVPCQCGSRKTWERVGFGPT